jgi:hypothetical protein
MMKNPLIVLAVSTVILGQGMVVANAANAQIPAKIQNMIEHFLDGSKPSTPNYEGAQSRAMNLARQAAERANGGLNNYRAESSMYGPATRAPFKDNGNGTLTFTFLGGLPAAAPSIESVVTVALNGDAVSVDYNGPIRFTGR